MTRCPHCDDDAPSLLFVGFAYAMSGAVTGFMIGLALGLGW